MGTCCGASKSYEYKHGGKVHKIGEKHVETIDRFGQGATARRQVQQMKVKLAKDIADLKKPSWDEEETQKSKETLMTEKEFNAFMEDADGGKNLVWNNYYTVIDEVKEYRGQWRKDRAVWEGLGEIKFKDGSLYQGQVKNKTFHGKGKMTHTNGDIYQGEWKDGKAEGYGIFVDSTGSIYEGQWKNDRQHGKGVERWDRGVI